MSSVVTLTDMLRQTEKHLSHIESALLESPYERGLRLEHASLTKHHRQLESHCASLAQELTDAGEKVLLVLSQDASAT